MTKHLVFTERYFPPLGAMPLPGRDGTETGDAWFPLHLLLEQIGRCSCCSAPAAYILAANPGAGAALFACLPVCDADVCAMAEITDAGHDACPKCHAGWTFDPAITAEFLAPVLSGGS